ncbi:coiled-coil and C2 domain-containing protein 1-like isoform X2 [Zootermopsis nevadensis]|uniref:coiled-coil and C2 domain-containing protein 1-like isoform X2 n=1 Tax=Zootermopsis nevadensis TaxID=136037 RepID=UPI000B8EE6E4|nr:coiled-coil and C2 domain-containing protein 1-like isoform X2 [Zootermopsis nevadensis]
MFGRRKEEKRRMNDGRGLSQFGLLDVPNLNDFGNIEVMGGVDDYEDDDLEAELMALTSGKSPTRPKRVRPTPVNMDVMVSECMRDIPTDEELSEDENDSYLLDELSALSKDEVEEPVPHHVAEGLSVGPGNMELSLVAMLEERLKMYQEAEGSAKAAGETSRARRFGRGIKTLNDLLKQALSGKAVSEEEIPPPVVTVAGKKSVEPDLPSSARSPPSKELPVPSRPAPPPPVSVQPPPVPPHPPLGVPLPGIVADDINNSTSQSPVELTGEGSKTLNMLKERQSQYKQAALQAKRAGNNTLAIQYVRTVKQFDPVIAALQEGQPVDLSAMPLPPPDFVVPASALSGQKEEGERQCTSEEVPALVNDQVVPPTELTETAPLVESEVDIYSAPPAPTTVMEALEQRLLKYRSVEQAARDDGNTSKARRMGRIVKQYENAIKLHNAGRPIPVDELPNPPGFGPIPLGGGGTAPTTTSPSEDRAPSPVPTVLTPAAAAASSPILRPKEDQSGTAPTTSGPETPLKINVRKTPQSRQEKQLAFLLARQKEFKEAALQAKRKGEVNQAKEYLRLAKGFDPLIEASNCGLPVDMDTVPIPPDTRVVLESDFDFVTVDDCVPGSDAEIFDKLEEDLLKQTKMCLTTRDHFKAIGDVASANRFEQLALHSKKDLNAVRCAHKRSESIPKFHYETKSFSIVQCCTDLGDNDLELTIIQGINYTVSNPKDVDTYVKFEFPYPSEDPPKDRTSLVKDTNNPEYNSTFNLTIHRNSRACQRVFKRHGIKLEVWSRGSWKVASQ